MKQLSGTWFNPTASNILDDAANRDKTLEDWLAENTYKTLINDQFMREEGKYKINEFMIRTIYLFERYCMICFDKMMEPVEIKMIMIMKS